MIFVVLGPSGCGKGTQAGLLAKKYSLSHISTGDLLRRAYEQKTSVGLKAFEWWGKGRWAPTELVVTLLEEELKKYPKGNFVLEGWPRYDEQTVLLEGILERMGLKIDRVFYLDTPREVSYERVLGRVKKVAESGKAPRPDDTEEVIQKRLDTYYDTVEPILRYYRDQGILTVIDNKPSIEEVFRAIEEKIDDHLQNG